jgi:uncharacterized repeat protein (TIGR03803 family)
MASTHTSDTTHFPQEVNTMDRPLTRYIARLETILFFVLAAAVFHPSPAIAQSFCGPLIPVNFSGPLGGNNTNGQYPSGYLAMDGKGNVYGTTPGTIWKYSPTGGFTTLFAPSTGPGFNGVILDSQGNLWGSTGSGGTNGNGTIFEFTTAGVFNTVFDFDGTNGAGPNPLVFDSQGNLWGSTGGGGTNGDGTLFKYSPASGDLTNPLDFTGGSTTEPVGSVTFDSQGNLYGVTYGGGTDGFGSLWEYSSQGVFTTLVNFTGLNGEIPMAGVTLDGKGNIYGTTYEGGAGAIPPASGNGSVWKYSLQTGELTTLYSFTASGTTGYGPVGAVTLDANGNLYGTTLEGGTYGDGVVWEYSPTTGVLTDLVNFNGANGENPESTLVLDSLGNLWGTTHQGGAVGYGTVFELTPNTGAGCGPTLSSLTFDPTTIVNGGTSTGTVTLSGEAPSGGSVVNLSSNSSFIIVPGSVTVPAGATSATFEVTTNGFVLSDTAVTITATLGSSTVQASLTETTGVAVKSISLKPSSVTGGTSTTATITLTAAAPSGGNQVLVEFCANCNPADPNPPVQLPVTVTVPAGQTSLSFSIGTLCTSTSEVVPIFAESGGASVSTNLTVKPGSSCVPNIASVDLVSTVTGGNSLTGTVVLTANAPSGGAVVTLSSNGGSATVPSSVTVAAGNTSASFTVTTTSVTTTTTAVITGTLGSSSAQASLTITPASAVSVSQLILNPIDVTGGSTSTGTVSLSAGAPPGGSVVTLSSSSVSASLPSSVTVAAGNTSASFTITTTSVTTTTTAVITGTLGSGSAQASLTILPAASVSLSSLTLNPTSVSGGSSSTGTVTLSGNAPSGGAVVMLTSRNTSVATVPSSVTVAAGSTSATFTVSTQKVSQNTNVTISGTYAGATQSATLTVTSGKHH